MSPPSLHETSADDFVRWAVAQLQLPTHPRDHGVLRLTLPEAEQAAFGGQETLDFSLDGHTSRSDAADPGTQTPPETEETLESLVVSGRLFQWLCQSLRSSAVAVPCRPARQPMSVHDLSKQLFPAYEVVGGSVHLSGCSLEDRPFLRLTYAHGSADGEVGLDHYFYTPDGSPVTTQQIDGLGLDELVPTTAPHPKIEPEQLELLIAAGQRHAQREEPLVAAVVWVKYVSGRLQMTIGSASQAVDFEGWASMLTPPPLACAHSGLQSYRVDATDDGRIVAAEAIARCDASGRRVVDRELVECSVTGQRVLEEFVETCPVSGKPALKDQMVGCAVCQQIVSRAVLAHGICSACRSLGPIEKDDPRIAWILAEYPGLDRLRKWRLAETSRVYIVQTGSFWKRWLLVVDRETLAVQHMATRGRFSKVWIPLEEPHRGELLG